MTYSARQNSPKWSFAAETYAECAASGLSNIPRWNCLPRTTICANHLLRILFTPFGRPLLFAFLILWFAVLLDRDAARKLSHPSFNELPSL